VGDVKTMLKIPSYPAKVEKAWRTERGETRSDLCREGWFCEYCTEFKGIRPMYRRVVHSIEDATIEIIRLKLDPEKCDFTSI
jgi:hypothetical protein